MSVDDCTGLRKTRVPFVYLSKLAEEALNPKELAPRIRKVRRVARHDGMSSDRVVEA